MSPKKNIDKKNLKTRVLSGAVIAVLTLGLGILGGWYWFAFTAVLSMMGLFEFYKAFQIERMPIGYLGMAFSALYWAVLALGKPELGLPIIVGAFLILCGAYVFDFTRIDAQKAMASFFGIVYTVVLLSFLYRIRTMTDGLYTIWLVFIGSWGCDTCAYFFGILFGKHKMAPVLSPKKSVEGAFGGVFGSVVIGLVFGILFGRHFEEITSPVLACAVISGAAAVISMVGDLTASAFKRNLGIKDYSHVIPGHGGILDRLDSVIFVAPVIYFGAYLFERLL